MGDNGMLDKAAGKVKEVAGDVTGNDELKGEGLMDQIVGAAKDAVNSAREAVEGVIEDPQGALDAAGEAVGNAVEGVKGAASEAADKVREVAEGK